MPDEVLNAPLQDTTPTPEAVSTVSDAPAAAVETTATPTPKTPDQVRAGMLEKINTALDAGKPKDDAAQVAAAAAKGADPAKAVSGAPPKKDGAAAGKDDPKKAPVDDKKRIDDLLTKPEGLSPKADGRFQALANEVRTQVTRAETAETKAKEHETTINGFRDILRDTQTTSEDLSQMLEYNRMVKSGNLEGALQILDGQRAALARALGRPIEGVDVLEGFNDLKQDVQDGKITLERAAEIARGRHVDTSLRAQNDRTRQQQQGQQERQQQVDGALSEITKFSKDMAASDVDYPAKEKILLAAIEEISKEFPPALWAKQVKMMYRTITVAPAAAAPVTTHQPLRPNSGGGGKPKPKSMFDAVSAGLGYSPGA